MSMYSSTRWTQLILIQGDNDEKFCKGCWVHDQTKPFERRSVIRELPHIDVVVENRALNKRLRLGHQGRRLDVGKKCLVTARRLHCQNRITTIIRPVVPWSRQFHCLSVTYVLAVKSLQSQSGTLRCCLPRERGADLFGTVEVSDVSEGSLPSIT